MVITIDTEEMKISLDSSVSLGDFFEELEKVLPNGAWGEYVLESTVEYIPEPVHLPFHVTCTHDGCSCINCAE